MEFVDAFCVNRLKVYKDRQANSSHLATKLTLSDRAQTFVPGQPAADARYLRTCAGWDERYANC
jgi:hypothetical protein